MKNEQIFLNSELISLLIKYVEINKIVFPIGKTKYLSNKEIVKILKKCINNQTIYKIKYGKNKLWLYKRFLRLNL